MDLSWFKRFAIERSHASFRSGSIWRTKFKTILMHCTGLVRFAVSHKVLKHLRWYVASYAGRSSKLTPSFILNLVLFFTLHCFLSLSITLWYCMVISLVSPWCYLRPCTLALYTMDLVLEDHTMDLTLEKLRMRDFLGYKILNNI